MLNGKLFVAEQCYQKCRRFDKLLFLYVLTGQRKKLVKLGRIFRVRGEWSQLVTVMMILGDSDGLMDSLVATGQNRYLFDQGFILSFLMRLCSMVDLMKTTEGKSRLPTSMMEVVVPSATDWPTAAPIKEVKMAKNKTKLRETLQEQYRDQLKQSFNSSL